MKYKSQQKRKTKKKPSADGATSDVKTKELDDEKRRIELLMEAFCSVSMEEANKAAEILSDVVENSDDNPSANSGQETGSTSEYGAGSSSSCGDDVARERFFKGSKQKRVIAATEMVSSVIPKDYLKKEEFPFVERCKEFSRKKA